MDELSVKEKEYIDNPVSEFEELNLKDDLERGIYGYGFEKPSVIQKTAIRPIIDGCDVIGQAQSGTGKTATYTIGVLQRIDEKVPETQAVILTHTREWALQVSSVVSALSTFMNITINL